LDRLQSGVEFRLTAGGELDVRASVAKRRAVAAPMPLVAPVIRAIFLLKLPTLVLLLSFDERMPSSAVAGCDLKDYRCRDTSK
jgi:hypothetical protein